MLGHEALKGTILPSISLDEYMPKVSDTKDIIVVAFRTTDLDPANDLNTFLQRGFIDIEDSEVSKTTDELGNYLVFVELKRTKDFKTVFFDLIRDVENVSGKQEWEVKPYLSDNAYQYTDPVLFQFVIMNKNDYLTKKDFIKQNMKEHIESFFKYSIANLTIREKAVIIAVQQHKVGANVVDTGLLEDVLKRNMLTESAFVLRDIPYEIKMLKSILGKNYNCAKIGNYTLIENINNEVILLKNVEVVYGSINGQG